MFRQSVLPEFFCRFLTMTVAPTTVRLSMLSQHHQQLLKEILDTVGVVVPCCIRIVNDLGGRSRSVSRGRSGVRSRSVSRPKVQNSDLGELMNEFQLFFASNQFRSLHAWTWKPIPPAGLVAKIDSVLAYVADYLQRDDGIEVGSLVLKFFSEKLGLKNLVEFSVLDLLYSSLRHRRSIMEVDIFVRALTGFYDSTDIVFHDFVKRSIRSTASPLISFPNCVQITRGIFGPQQAFVAEAVIETLANEVRSSSEADNVSVHVSYLIYITVWVFHHHRNDLDVRSSQHGFEDMVRQSFQVKDNKNLIDSYVDSILELKSMTRQLRDQQIHQHEPLRESHLELEKAVKTILAQSCAKHGSSVEDADKLMQSVMSEDRSTWVEITGRDSGWSMAIRLRDQLLHTSDSPQMEYHLRQFCDAIALSAAAPSAALSYY